MTISPGWYKDPAEPATQRYWDGEGWIGTPLPVDATPPAGPPPGTPTRSITTPTQPTPSLARSTHSPTQTEPPSVPPTQNASPTSAPPTLNTFPTSAPSTQNASPAALTAPAQQPPPQYRAPQVPARPHGLPLAGLGARFVARLIDMGLILLLNAVVNGWFIYRYVQKAWPYSQQLFNTMMANGSVNDVPKPAQMDSLLIVITLLAMALWLAYEVPATAHAGQTIGKRVARIKVVRVESQEPLGVLRALRRWNPMGMPLLALWCCGPFLIAFQIFDVIYIAIDRVNRMALHDRSAATYVVQLPATPRRKGK